MIDTCACNNTMTYKKAIPSEIIELGDIVMLDPGTNYIKRAVANDFGDLMINSRLIVGVCVKSNNTAPIPDMLDGGPSEELDRELIDSGVSDSIQTIIIESGTSDQNSREIIQVAYSGEQVVNICGFVDLGDRLCISSHPGKAKSKDYLDDEYFKARSIGKVIQFTNKKEQVKALIDIE